MIFPFLILTFVTLAQCQFGSLAPQAVHYTLQRRGGAAFMNRTANLPWLLEQLGLAEARFNMTRREVRGNNLVRVPKELSPEAGMGERLIGEIGRPGNWFATLELGASSQPIDMDIDMLTADFAVRSTSSPHGTKFDSFFSNSYSRTGQRPFENCEVCRDQTRLPTLKSSFHMQFPHCEPSRQSRQTLLASGAIMGLAPSTSLRQIELDSFLKQLVDMRLVDSEVFSLTLINGEEGLLTLGGTAAESVQTISDRIETFLGSKSGDSFTAQQVLDPLQDREDAINGAPQAMLGGNVEIPANLPANLPPNLAKRDLDVFVDEAANSEAQSVHSFGKRDLDFGIDDNRSPKVKRASRNRVADHKKLPSWRDQWSWSPVEGADGWWQTLLRGAWIDEAKVLKNQPCIIDINTPFILAPPLAAKAFYGSISGSRRLPPPYSNFYAYPCNNPPAIAFEFGGWRFPVMRGMKGYKESNGPNGKFSLGKVSDDSGYCVGAVVETRIGVGDQVPQKQRHSRKEDAARGFGSIEAGMIAGNGMRDVWILGEQAFRGLGMVFDPNTKEVGFRTY